MATPYSKYPGGIEAAYQEACRQQAVLVKAGIHVFCPIGATHGAAIHGGIDPLDHLIWIPADAPFMAISYDLIVCQMESWESSYGIKVEIDTFKNAKKPILYMTPGTVPKELT